VARRPARAAIAEEVAPMLGSSGRLDGVTRPVKRASVILAALGAAAYMLSAGPGQAVVGAPAHASSRSARPATEGPIQHVVVILQENHSFDNVLGKWCAINARCDGATTGLLSDGTSISLPPAKDIVGPALHTVLAQRTAIDGGNMDDFNLAGNCGPSTGFECYQQFDPTQVPNLVALADQFAVSDRTFEFRTTPSFVGHMIFAAATQDDFQGDNPRHVLPGFSRGPGWGCDSNLETGWSSTGRPPYVLVPTCVPDQSGNGPAVPSPVSYVPTIFDRLDAAGLRWMLYSGTGQPGTPTGTSGYGWGICPTFYECLSTEASHYVPANHILTAAAAGTLPSFSVVTPTGPRSQHNGDSMAVGDNWIGSVVGAIENGPDWGSTAVFITYDDCGCFYDHVNPLQYDPNWGIRIPMVIVSPYARPGFTDSTPVTFLGILAYVEHQFGLQPLVPSADGASYDFSDAFDYDQAPIPPVPMTSTSIPPSEREYLGAHPVVGNDPT
jgi:phospholipase C